MVCITQNNTLGCDVRRRTDQLGDHWKQMFPQREVYFNTPRPFRRTQCCRRCCCDLTVRAGIVVPLQLTIIGICEDLGTPTPRAITHWRTPTRLLCPAVLLPAVQGGEMHWTYLFYNPAWLVSTAVLALVVRLQRRGRWNPLACPVQLKGKTAIVTGANTGQFKSSAASSPPVCVCWCVRQVVALRL